MTSILGLDAYIRVPLPSGAVLVPAVDAYIEAMPDGRDVAVIEIAKLPEIKLGELTQVEEVGSFSRRWNVCSTSGTMSDLPGPTIDCPVCGREVKVNGNRTIRRHVRKDMP